MKSTIATETNANENEWARQKYNGADEEGRAPHKRRRKAGVRQKRASMQIEWAQQ